MTSFTKAKSMAWLVKVVSWQCWQHWYMVWGAGWWNNIKMTTNTVSQQWWASTVHVDLRYLSQF